MAERRKALSLVGKEGQEQLRVTLAAAREVFSLLASVQSNSEQKKIDSQELVQEAIANFEKESASLESIYLNLLSLEDGLEENEKTAEERDGMEDDALAAARGKRDALRDEVRRKNEVLCILMKRTREMVLLLQQLQLQKNSGER